MRTPMKQSKIVCLLVFTILLGWHLSAPLAQSMHGRFESQRSRPAPTTSCIGKPHLWCTTLAAWPSRYGRVPFPGYPPGSFPFQRTDPALPKAYSCGIRTGMSRNWWKNKLGLLLCESPRLSRSQVLIPTEPLTINTGEVRTLDEHLRPIINMTLTSYAWLRRLIGKRDGTQSVVPTIVGG